MTNPRFGFNSLPHLFKDGVICIGDDPVHTCFNALDWRPKTFWRGQQLSNGVGNGDFLLWTAGPAAPPDGWAVTGAGAVPSQGTPIDPQVQPFVAELTRVGADAAYTQDLADGSPEDLVGQLRGCAFYVRTSVAGQARITLDDGVGTTSSAFHTGGGAWERLVVSKNVAPGATKLEAQLEVRTVNGLVEFDAGVETELVFGQVAPPEYSEVAESMLLVYPTDNQLLRNWLKDSWSGGGEANPDLHVAVQGAPVYERTTDARLGRYANQMTGTDLAVGEELSGVDLQDAQGKLLWYGTWAKSTSALAQVGFVLRFRDGSLSSVIPGTGATRVHTGGGAWEFLSTSMQVPHDVIGVFGVDVHATGAAFTAQWDGALLARQDAAIVATPHAKPVDFIAGASHNLGTSCQQLVLDGSDDNFVTPVPVITSTPTTDSPFWNDIDSVPGPAMHGAYRVRNPNLGLGNVSTIEVGVLLFGKYLEMPCPPRQPLSVNNRRFQSELVKTRERVPLGRSIPAESRQMNFVWPILLYTFVKAEIENNFWLHAGGTSGLPFFFQWNDDGFPDEVVYLWYPDAAAYAPQRRSGGLVLNLTMNFEGFVG